MQSHYVNFGNSALKVSKVALGLGFRGQNDESEATKTINTAIDKGINLIDCANVYGYMDDRKNIGSSEKLLGKILQNKRNDLVITSKVASPMGRGPNDEGVSRYHIINQVEKSLERLSTDRIDIYIFHVFHSIRFFEEQFRAMEILKNQGKILYVGVSNYKSWQVIQALRVQDSINAEPLLCVQNPYSLLNRSSEYDMFPMINDLGLGFMAYSPLGVGLLSGAYAPNQEPGVDTLWGSTRKNDYENFLSGETGLFINRLDEISKNLGIKMSQLAISWVLSHPEVSLAISGADNSDQISEAADAMTIKLPLEIRKELNEASSRIHHILD
ncbi:MAG: aldo/keto reductase [Dehalococcoidia bacterium]